MAGGSPVALSRRIAALDPGSFSIFTGEKRVLSNKQTTGWLPARYHFLDDPRPSDPPHFGAASRTARAWLPATARDLPIVSPALRSARDAIHLIFRRNAVRRRAIEIIRTERPDLVLTTSDDGVFLTGAYEAARATRTPLFVMFFDIYAGNNYSWVKRAFARAYEGRILRAAEAVFVTNNATREHYRQLYQVDSVVIEHPAPAHKAVEARPAGREPVIAYTGSIYWAQRDAFQALVRALDQLPSTHVRIISDLSPEMLRRQGVSGDRLSVIHSELSGVEDYQRRADILYLPLAFKSRAPDVIRTAAPGKLAEYLVAGVPILVHAPSSSYIARDAREHGWGFVIDTLEPAELVNGISALLNDRELRRSLVKNAFDIAGSRHDASRVREQLRRRLGLDLQA